MRGTTMVLLAAAAVLACGSPPERAETSAERADGAAEAPTPAGVVEVRLALRDGRLVVPVGTDDGRELSFALSTGSDRTILTESGEQRIGGAALDLVGLPLPTTPHATVRDADLTVGGEVLDGQISSNMLADYDLLVDVPGGRLVLKPIGPSVSFDGVALSEPIPLRILHGVVISLDVELNGAPFPASLDLGARTLIANRGVQSDLSIDAEDTVTLGLGAATFEDVPVRVLDLDIFERWSPTGSGFVIVGAPVLERCAMSLSWAHAELRTCDR